MKKIWLIKWLICIKIISLFKLKGTVGPFQSRNRTMDKQRKIKTPNVINFIYSSLVNLQYSARKYPTAMQMRNLCLSVFTLLYFSSSQVCLDTDIQINRLSSQSSRHTGNQ